MTIAGVKKTAEDRARAEAAKADAPSETRATSAGPLICGFLKVYNERLRGNLSRVLDNMGRYCDTIVVCDDGSEDDSIALIRRHVPEDQVLRYEAPDFEGEIGRKQRMLDIVHRIQPQWVFWLDGDEVLDADGVEGIRGFVRHAPREVQAYRFHEENLWRSHAYKRVDDGFDTGWFLRLWRYNPDLAFEVRHGLHRHQFPEQILCAIQGNAPFRVLHFGNDSTYRLKFKIAQYARWEVSWRRHALFAEASYRPVPPEWFPPGTAPVYTEWPEPLTPTFVQQALDIGGLTALPGYFAVVLPTHDRAGTLLRAIESVLEQSHEKWLLYILDDGSTDGTPDVVAPYLERDPRVFYARFDENRGGVAMNEVGMALACRSAEFWTRLGSDDWWRPEKLQHDKEAFDAGADAVWGPFQVWRGRPAELCAAVDTDPARFREEVAGGRFLGSWANVAVRTDVLAHVRDTWGHFCDLRLRNMEDFLVNARVARVADWHWRPGTDGWWNVDPVGASGGANAEVYTHDERLTRELLAEDSRGPPRLHIREVRARALASTRTEPSSGGDGAKGAPLPAPAAAPTFRPRRTLPVPIHATPDVLHRRRAAALLPIDRERFYPDHAGIIGAANVVGKRTLDLGCASGADTCLYLLHGAEVWYADLAGECLEATRRAIAARCPDEAVSRKAHGLLLVAEEPVPLADGAVDVINSHGFLHDTGLDVAAVLSECWRTLRAGGTLYAMFFRDDAPGPVPAGYRGFPVPEAKRLLADAGFDVAGALEYQCGLFRTFQCVKPGAVATAAATPEVVQEAPRTVEAVPTPTPKPKPGRRPTKVP